MVIGCRIPCPCPNDKPQEFPHDAGRSGGLSLNKERVDDAGRRVTKADLLAGKYLLAQQGKKKHFLLIADGE